MSADESISTLQERIAFHENKASELQSLYNTHASIAKLPPEILSEVFLIQAALLRRDALDRYSQDTDVRHQSMYKWIRASHVCRRWRETALNCANLWTWVAFDQRVPVSYPDMLLERARNLPLSITLSITDPIGHCDGCLDMDWFFDNFHAQTATVCELVPRTRELLILIDRDDFEDRWEDILSNSSDVLEVFRIEAYGSSRYRQLSLPPRRASVRVTESLFESPPPNLRSLSFVGVECNWSNTLVHASLRHLELTSCQITESPDNSDLLAFLNALRPLSHLETLKLDWPLLTEIDESGCTPVSLPNLTWVHLRADNQRIVALLSYLQMPPTTSVRCTILDSFFNDSDRKPFQMALARLFENMTIHAVGWGTPMDHHIRGDTQTTCQIWAVQGRRAPPHWNGLSWEAMEATPPRLALEIGFRPSVDVVTPAALQALDLSYVETIHVAGCTPSRSWARALKKAENVKRLRVTGMAAFALPAVLAAGVPEDPEEDWQVCLDNEVADADEWHWAHFDGGAPMMGPMMGLRGLLQSGLGDIWAKHPTQPESAVGPAPAPVPPIFPRLHVLHILDVDIHMPPPPLDGQPWEETTCYPHGSDILFSRFNVARAKYGLSTSGLLKCLRLRAEQGATPVERVYFEKCVCAEPGLVRQLAGVGPEVLWDGLPVLPIQNGL